MKKKGVDSEAKKSFGIRLSPSLVVKLKHLAVDRGVMLNRVLEEAIIDYLKKNKAL